MAHKRNRKGSPSSYECRTQCSYVDYIFEELNSRIGHAYETVGTAFGAFCGVKTGTVGGGSAVGGSKAEFDNWSIRVNSSRSSHRERLEE